MAAREIGPLGPPPDDLAERDLITVEWTSPLYRVHRIDRNAVFFGRTRNNRFDDPSQEFGVLYAAEDVHGAFAETFGDVPALSVHALTANGYSTIRLGRPLHLADLRGNGLLRLGADMRLCAGEHADAQQWSRAIWFHPANVDGLCYPARHDPSRTALALYDRAEAALSAVAGGAFQDPSNTELTARILDHYGKALIDG